MLADPAISQRHALIMEKDDRVWIEDLGSTSGIFVNGRKIHEMSGIHTGDTIRIGHTRLAVLKPENAFARRHLVVHAIGFASEAAIDSRKLAAIYEITAELTGHQDMSVLGKRIFYHLKKIFSHDRGYIALFDRDGMLKPLLVDPDREPVPMNRGIADRVFQNGDSLLLEDIPGDASLSARQSLPKHTIGSALCTPLICRSQIYGLVYLDRMIPGAYSPDDLEFLKSIASIFAPIIENARLLAELKSHYDDAVEVLRKTEARLIETERAAAYVRLAQAMAHELRNPLMIIGGMVRKIARMHPQEDMGETREALMSSVERMEIILKEVDDLVAIPFPLVQLQRIDRLIEEEIRQHERHWQRKSICPFLTVSTPYVMAPVDPHLLKKAISMVFREILFTLPHGSELPMNVRDRNNELEILLGKTGSLERFRDLYDAELKYKPWSTSLFLSAAHKILTDHGGNLLLDPQAKNAFPVILRIPRSWKPEGPFLSADSAR